MKFKSGQCFQPTEQASDEEKLIARLITIVSHQIANATQESRSANEHNFFVSVSRKLSEDTASERAQKMKKGIQKLGLTLEKVTLWWVTLIQKPMKSSDREIYRGNLSEKDKLVYDFLYKNRKRQLNDEYEMKNELLQGLTAEELNGCLELQKK